MVEKNLYLCITTLNNLRDATGEVFDEILKIYIDDATININLLRTASKENNFDQLIRLTHTLKGSSRNVGAIKTAELCESFEKSLKENPSCDLEMHINLIQSSNESSLPLLKKQFETKS